jgi:hypothetical protein
MSDNQLTERLAVQVLGWRRAPGRFIKPGRGWTPDWCFQPLVNLADAFQVLDRAGAKYKLSCERDGSFTAQVQIGRNVGKASGKSKARTICLAVAQALGIEVDQ